MNVDDLIVKVNQKIVVATRHVHASDTPDQRSYEQGRVEALREVVVLLEAFKRQAGDE